MGDVDDGEALVGEDRPVVGVEPRPVGTPVALEAREAQGPFTESAVGVAGVLVSTAVRGEFSLVMLKEAALQTLSTCGMIVWIGIGASALDWIRSW